MAKCKDAKGGAKLGIAARTAAQAPALVRIVMNPKASDASPAAARHAPPDRLVIWEAAGEDCRIVCPEALLESIRRECALAARGPVPLGVGGALLGECSGGTYRIRSWHRIPCRHQRGPSFLLSKEEVAGLKEFLSRLLAQAGSAEDQIVGWFVSHPHTGAMLRDDEISLHQRFFRAKDLFLLVEIGPSGVAEITVHRGAAPLEPGWRVIPAPVHFRKDGDASEALPPAADESLSAPGGQAAAAGAPRLSSGVKWALALAALAALAGSGWYVGKVLRTPPPPLPATLRPPLTTLSLSLEKQERGFLIRWNALEPFLLHAQRAWIRIHDGPVIREEALDPARLQAGTYLYPTASPVLEVEMRTEFADGRTSRERVRYQP